MYVKNPKDLGDSNINLTKEYVQEGEYQTKLNDDEERDNNSLLVSGFITPYQRYVDSYNMNWQLN